MSRRTRLRALLGSPYGSTPLQLLALLGAFAVTGWVVSKVVNISDARGVAIWFLACVIGHDLVLLPLYSLLHAIADFGAGHEGLLPSRMVPALPYLRVPTALSALMLLVYAPLILGLSKDHYTSATGQNLNVYLGRWLALSAGLFIGSALIYAVRLRRAHQRGTTAATPPPAD